MNIWVDADACPVAIKDILCRAAERTQVQVTFVANQFIRIPPSRYIVFIQVPPGFDVADNEIVNRLSAGDLVITGDIPLAAEVVEMGAYGLNHRGELYTENNIRESLNIRDFMDTLRSSGVSTQGPRTLSVSDRQDFANHLDKFLSQRKK